MRRNKYTFLPTENVLIAAYVADSFKLNLFRNDSVRVRYEKIICINKTKRSYIPIENVCFVSGVSNLCIQGLIQQIFRIQT